MIQHARKLQTTQAKNSRGHLFFRSSTCRASNRSVTAHHGIRHDGVPSFGRTVLPLRGFPFGFPMLLLVGKKLANISVKLRTLSTCSPPVFRFYQHSIKLNQRNQSFSAWRQPIHKPHCTKVQTKVEPLTKHCKHCRSCHRLSLEKDQAWAGWRIKDTLAKISYGAECAKRLQKGPKIRILG